MTFLRILLFNLIILIILTNNKCQCNEIEKELSPIFAFFIEFQSCASCNFLPINLNINEIEKIYPDSQILVFIKIADSSFIYEDMKSKIKSKNIIYLTPENSDKYEQTFHLPYYPALIVFNFNGDELLQFSGEDFKQISINKINNIITKQFIEGAKKINYPIGIPKTQVISILDSIVYYVDIVKNEIGEFSIVTGDSINTIKPDDYLRNYSLSKLSENDENWLNDRLYPLTNYQSVVPLSHNNILCITTNVSGVTSDTSFIPKNDTIETNVCKVIKTRNVLANIQNGNTQNIYTFPKQEYSIHHLIKLKNDKIGASLNIRNKKKYLSDLKLLDSAYIFVQSSKNDFSDAEFLLSYSELMKAYGLDSINLYTLGLMDYCPEKDTYFYLNPFMKVFIAYKKSKDQIIKITPKGLLSYLFQPNNNIIKLYNKEFKIKYEYILMDWFIDNDKMNVLILPRNKQKFTNFFVLSSYDFEGNFINETYYYYKDLENIFRVHLFGDIESNNSYLMIQSKNRKWQLYRNE